MTLKVKKQHRIVGNATRKYWKKTVLITGSSGFIGSSLARAFFDIDCKLRLLYHGQPLAAPGKTAASIKFIRGDVTREDVWRRALKGVDVVFHLAALESSRSNYDIYKDLSVNVAAVAGLLEVCRKTGFKGKIIFSSSVNLFGPAESLPLNEKSLTTPVSLWAAHKLTAENYLKVYGLKYGIRFDTLRLANLYGPAYNEKATCNMVVNKVIASGLAGNDLRLYRNSGCLRDYLYIDDAVRAFILAGTLDRRPPENGYYVVGSGEGLTIARAWRFISLEAGQSIGKKISIRTDRKTVLDPVEYREFVADSGLFSRATGWSALMTFRNGIRETARSMRGRKP